MDKQYKNLVFKELKESDIFILTPIMKKAFDMDTQIHLDVMSGGPSGYDDGSFLRKYALDEASTAYTIYMDEEIIGAVILWIDTKNQCNSLGNIFIDVKYESMGIGESVWRFIEHEFPQTKVWKADTPIYSRRNHHFYVNKCGFHIVKIVNPRSLEDGYYQMEKRFE